MTFFTIATQSLKAEGFKPVIVAKFGIGNLLTNNTEGDKKQRYFKP